MRRAFLTIALGFFVAVLACALRAPPRPQPVADAPAVRAPHGPLYDADANHIWNRVDQLLRVRVAADGQEFGADSLDPLLWRETRHLLTPPSHESTLALLDRFLDQQAEQLVTDPLRRAVLQRDLWAVFDWTVAHGEALGAERHALAGRLARMIRRVALSPDDIERLPETYAAAVASARYPDAYDPVRPDESFLPVRLFDSGGTWIAIHGNTPVAQHGDELSRSWFGVFLNMPGGRDATLAHLRTLWTAADPFVADPVGSFGGEQRTAINPALHPLPPGTQIALARAMLLVDTNGQIRRTRILESLQLRVFRPAEPCRRPDCGANDQDFYEFVLDRGGLFRSAATGLRAIERTETGFLTFSSHGIDPFERDPPRLVSASPTLRMCVACHHQPGLASVLTARRLFKPFTSAAAGGPGGDGMPEFWKSRRADWGYLTALWRTLPD